MWRVTTILCLLLIGCASAPRASEADAYEPHLLIQQPISQIPLINAGNRQWQVRAEINGVPGLFTVDTGSDATILSVEFAQKIGLLDTATKGRFVGPNPIAQKVRFARITSLQIGGILYLNFHAPIINLDHINRAMLSKIDGILGNNILGQTACTLDWQKNLLTLDAHLLSPPTNAIAVKTRNHRIYLTAILNGEPVEFVLDSGSFCSALTEKQMKRLNLPESKKSLVEGPQISIAENNHAKRVQASFDTFQVGPIMRTNFPVITWDNNVLGMDFLDSWILTFDARRNWLSFTQSP